MFLDSSFFSSRHWSFLSSLGPSASAAFPFLYELFTETMSVKVVESWTRLRRCLMGAAGKGWYVIFVFVTPLKFNILNLNPEKRENRHLKIGHFFKGNFIFRLLVFRGELLVSQRVSLLHSTLPYGGKWESYFFGALSLSIFSPK